MRHHIYLIPGFFGFANVGRLRYFLHVRTFLLQELGARGIDAEVHVVKTYPTASLPKRTARAIETIAGTIGDQDVAHLIGHSTGGLDARLAVAPNVSLPTPRPVEALAQRVRTVISVATPHFGSPLASFLAGMRGQKLLELLSVTTTYVLRFGSLPLAVLLSLASLFTDADARGRNPTLIDELFHQLLADFSVGRRRAVQRLLADVAKDQALLVQLTPEGMDVFNATVRDRAEIRYGSVVTRATPPGVGSTLATGLDAAAQANHTLYHGLHRLAAQMPRGRQPPLSAAARETLRRAYRRLPSLKANDGIVPTRAQVWGEVIQAVQADHLDIIGHFGDPTRSPPHYDWLATRTGFTRAKFEDLWRQVMGFMLEPKRSG
ncbi:MAG TPA: triacylglycerol lipase [Candidatus Binatia bacterium]|nr:triacylglycerol lipase [Candidatus Binatia bacterium]